MSDKSQSNVTGTKCPFHEPRFPQATRDVTSKNMAGISDLVVWAPIKEGFIDAFGNVTFASRLRIVAEALNKLRKNVREFQFSETFADPTKRILSLLDFRIGVVDRDLYGFGANSEPESETLRPRQYMYLTATFDGPWEPYMRQIWRPMGPFLDLILCNCEEYPISTETNFEEYIDWVRAHLLDTGMFYLVTGQTVKDHFYLKGVERYEREIENPHERDVKIATHTVPTPEDQTRDIREREPSEAMRLALEALNVLYQLTSFYPADKEEGKLLWTATKVILEDEDLMRTLECTRDRHPKQEERKKAEIILYKLRDQLTWYDKAYKAKPKCPMIDRRPANDSAVQKGIISSYDEGLGEMPITHGATLLIKITDPKKARLFLHPIFWSWEGQTYPFFRNLAFTFSGLEKMPLSEGELMGFPKEFREGMKDRAPLIGDMHHNHPQRWRLPLRNGKGGVAADKLPRVSLDEVDLIVQLRTVLHGVEFDGEESYIKFEDSPSLDVKAAPLKTFSEPLSLEEFVESILSDNSSSDQLPDLVKESLEALYTEVINLSDTSQAVLVEAFIEYIRSYGHLLGVELLSIQSSYRRGVTASSQNTKDNPFTDRPVTEDHFGFKDGLSQPDIQDLDFNDIDAIKKSTPLAIKRGDLIVGFSNLLGDPQSSNDLKEFQSNGSFLAIRKMRQDVEAFEIFLEQNAGQNTGKQDFLAAKLMGRHKDGKPLITGASDNTFDYESDTKGLQCPFVSHIRRANPRDIVHGRKAPKIVRRGMSYGDKFSDAPDEERGIIFMAYCANLAEQFETIQRWINGGNSTNIGSAQIDPIVGPPPATGNDVVKFAENGASGINVHRLHRDPKRPFVQLEWGVYAFAPGKKALGGLYDDLKNWDGKRTKLADSAQRGEDVVKAIEALESSAHRNREWKTLLEDYMSKDPDEHAVTSDVWAYIRKRHKGVYKIAEGVGGHNQQESQKTVILIADKQKIENVLKNTKVFSNSEIGTRLNDVFAPHYIGMDPDPSVPKDKDLYYKESLVTNSALYAYQASPAFDLAYKRSKALLDKTKRTTACVFRRDKFKLELTREYFAPSLAALCQEWFGVLDGEFFESGAFVFDKTRGDPSKTRCPGDFLAPSRGSFYPRPTPAIWEYAQNHGGRLKSSVDKLTAHWQKSGVKGIISKEVYNNQKDYNLLGRNIIGAMIGMLPSSEATLRMVTKSWLDEGTFWQLQGDLLSLTDGKAPSYEHARTALENALIAGMSVRPAPDLLYRRAVTGGEIGDVRYKAGDTIILSLVSAMEADLEAGTPDINTVFGGKRTKDPIHGGGYNPEGIPHACPAKEMAMGALLGILAALMTSGRIQAMAASLILEISDWEVPEP